MSTSARAATRTNWLAIIGFVLSLLGLLGAIAFWLVFPPAFSLVGAILGYFGLQAARRGAGREGLAKAALILGVIAFIINVALIIIGAAGGFGD